MEQKRELPEFRDGKATDNMITHLGKGRITATSGRVAPNRNFRMLHEGNDPSGPSDMHKPYH
eukprot:12419903-Karenia_brevis.AAC.1